jgi:SAM-dependent methyltransferase
MADSRIQDECKAFWERCFAEFPFDFSHLSARVTEPMISRLKLRGCIKVLDLGCGFGKWSIALSEVGFEVTAVDLAQAAIDWLRKWTHCENLTIETVVSSPQSYCRPEFFDAVICKSVLDHMPLEDAACSMSNIVASLKTGGVCYLSFDGHETEDPALLETLSDGTRRYTAGKRRGMLWRFYSDDEIRSLCALLNVIEMISESNGRRIVWLEKRSQSLR